MASNDYYNSFAPGDSPASRPPPPQHTPSAQSLQSLSPVTSPFDDRYENDHNHSSTAHLTHSQTGASSTYSDTAYHGADPYSNQAHPYNQRYDSPPAATHQDPFADQNAIPLQQQGKMHPSHGAAGVYQMDPEGRPGRRPRDKKKKKKGWFSGRVTWVVYILTAVQIGVFVGELIRNGTYTAHSRSEHGAKRLEGVFATFLSARRGAES